MVTHRRRRRRFRAARTELSPAQRAAAPPRCAGAAPWSASPSSSVFVAAGALRAAASRRTIRSDQLAARCASRRRCCTGSAPTSSAATCCRASIWGDARLADGGRGLGLHRAGARRADRHAGRLSRRLGRRADLAHHRCDAGLPVPDPGHRARGVPRAQPDQRDDRDRHHGDADLHPPHARPGPVGQGRRIMSRPRARSAIRICASRSATSCRT